MDCVGRIKNQTLRQFFLGVERTTSRFRLAYVSSFLRCARDRTAPKSDRCCVISMSRGGVVGLPQCVHNSESQVGRPKLDDVISSMNVVFLRAQFRLA